MAFEPYAYPEPPTPEQIAAQQEHEQREAEKWYRIGYDTGLTMYQGDNADQIAAGLAYYSQRGTLTHGSYEHGIADALHTRIEEAAS